MPAGLAVHGRDPQAAAVTGAGAAPRERRPAAVRAARPGLAGGAEPVHGDPGRGRRTSLDEGAAVRAVFWLPVLGAGLGLAGSAVMVFVAAGHLSPERQLLGAALAVALIAVATGGLHLDGLADTADGLGSRRPADQALEIMRRSDAGPLGVATLVLVLLVQVSALASLPRRGWAGAATGLVLAAVTSRVAVVLATGSPSARPSGFGALVAGRTSAAGRVASVVVLLARGGRGRPGAGRGGGRGPGAAGGGGRPGGGGPAPPGPRGGGSAG